jgi:hypothetical protein
LAAVKVVLHASLMTPPGWRVSPTLPYGIMSQTKVKGAMEAADVKFCSVKTIGSD